MNPEGKQAGRLQRYLNYGGRNFCGHSWHDIEVRYIIVRHDRVDCRQVVL